MPGKTTKPATVDEYIAKYPENVQSILQRLRALIKTAAPRAEEKISYNILGYFLDGGLLWLSANKRHIGLYPMSADTPAFEGKLLPYRGTKSALHFPLDQPMPYALIRKIVKYRVVENSKQTAQPPKRLPRNLRHLSDRTDKEINEGLSELIVRADDCRPARSIPTGIGK